MSTWGWRSHFYCLVPLGWALQAAGHEVRVACHPGLARDVCAAGLAAVPLGRDLDFAEVFAGRIGQVGRAVEPAITADGGVVAFADALLDDLVGYGRRFRPDLMLWEPFNLAAAVAAAALGAPGAAQLWGPDSSVTLRMDPEEVIGPLARRHGLGAADVRATGALLLDPAPPPMQVPLPEPSRAVRFVPYNGPAVLPDWLRSTARRPRVCITAGTMMAGAGLEDRMGLHRVVQAVAQLDVEVVVVVEPAQRTALGPLPDNVRVAGAPLALRLVLPECAALVQQGGAGTTMTALACGVPQLILPQVSDQHFNGERLAATGAGTWRDPADIDAQEIRSLLGELIGDGRWRAAATAMRERVLRTPSPAELVPVLESLAAGALVPTLTTTGAAEG